MRIKFIGDENSAKIYINEHLYATANNRKELRNHRNEIIGKSEKQNAIGLVMALFYINIKELQDFYNESLFVPGDIVPDDENNGMFTTSCVLMSDEAINEQQRMKADHERWEKEAQEEKEKKRNEETELFS